jgi:hypothetical protein
VIALVFKITDESCFAEKKINRQDPMISCEALSRGCPRGKTKLF